MKKLIFILAVTFLACDGDSPTSSEILVSATKGWTFSDYKIEEVPSSVELMYLLETCLKDDRYVFTAHGTYRRANAQTCNSGEPSGSESGTWTLTNDGKSLNLFPTGKTPYFTTVEIKPGQLIIEMRTMLNQQHVTIHITMEPE
jgi:hypothetical protein